MFNLLVSGNASAWDTTQPWSMRIERFKEYSGSKADEISARQPLTLKALEGVPTLLMYEWGVDGPSADVVRFGYMENIRTTGQLIQFTFREESHCDRDLIDEFASLLSLSDWERSRTHWAVKDGDIPRDVMQQMIQGPHRKFRFEVVLSYAGEDLAYVERVATFLRERGIELFFAPFNEADLWGNDLSEELDIVYRREGRYCVMFLSKDYARKAWPTHERRSALSRAVQDQGRYLLPCRFDDTEVPGLRPSVSYVDLNTKTPEQLGDLIIEVLRRKRKGMR